MTNRQTFWGVFIVAVLSMLTLIYCINKFNTELSNSTIINENLKKEIINLKSQDLSLKNDINILKNQIKDLEKDLDVTQELQRKQAFVILELRKGKKK